MREGAGCLGAMGADGGAQTFSPRARMRATTASIPCLSMVLRPFTDTVRVTVRPSEGTKNRFFCRFGSKRRLVRRWEWETLLPKLGAAPVT